MAGRLSLRCIKASAQLVRRREWLPALSHSLPSHCVLLKSEATSKQEDVQWPEKCSVIRSEGQRAPVAPADAPDPIVMSR